MPNRVLQRRVNPQKFTLDLITPRPVLACSVSRQLTNKYSDAIIKVRRSSDNTERDFYAPGSGLDLGGLSSFISSVAQNAFVTTVYDQSKSGFDLLQATASAQPRIALNSGIDTGSRKLPCMYFDGTNSFMYAGSQIDLRAGATIFMTYNVFTSKDYNFMLWVNDAYNVADAVDELEIYWQASGTTSGNIVTTANRGGAFSYAITGNALPLVGNYTTQVHRYSSTAITHGHELGNYAMGSVLQQTSLPVNIGFLYLGSGVDFLSTGTQKYYGRMHEIIIYNRALTSREIQVVAGDIAKYYGLTPWKRDLL